MFASTLGLRFSVAAFDGLSEAREKGPSVELLSAAKLADTRAGDRGFQIPTAIKLMQGMIAATTLFSCITSVQNHTMPPGDSVAR
jgi:tellurite resistance protein